LKNKLSSKPWVAITCYGGASPKKTGKFSAWVKVVVGRKRRNFNLGHVSYGSVKKGETCTKFKKSKEKKGT